MRGLSDWTACWPGRAGLARRSAGSPPPDLRGRRRDRLCLYGECPERRRQPMASGGIREPDPGDLFPGHRARPIPGHRAGVCGGLGCKGAQSPDRIRRSGSAGTCRSSRRPGAPLCASHCQAAASPGVVPRGGDQCLSGSLFTFRTVGETAARRRTHHRKRFCRPAWKCKDDR